MIYPVVRELAADQHPGRGGLPGPAACRPAATTPGATGPSHRGSGRTWSWSRSSATSTATPAQHLRLAAGARRAAPGPGHPGRPQAGGAADAHPPASSGCTAGAAAAAPCATRTPSPRRPGRAPVPRRPARRAVGLRHHPAPHRRGLGLLRGRAGRLLPPRRGLVHRRPPAHRVVVDALDMACLAPPTRRRSRQHRGPLRPRQPIHVWAFGQRLRTAGLLGSMGSIGDCFDNALAESFFSTLQLELLDRQPWATRQQLANAIFEWIEAWYNPTRRHSALDDHLSPTPPKAASHPRQTRQSNSRARRGTSWTGRLAPGLPYHDDRDDTASLRAIPDQGHQSRRAWIPQRRQHRLRLLLHWGLDWDPIPATHRQRSAAMLSRESREVQGGHGGRRRADHAIVQEPPRITSS